MRACIAGFFLFGFASGAFAQAPEAVPTGQLPRSAEPLRYELGFTLDPQREDFDGEARIRVRLHEAADHLWLHGLGLKVAAAGWRDAAGTQGEAKYSQVNDDGVARVDFGRTLAAQDIELSFEYSARYSRSLESIYKVQRGKDSYLVTQFEDIAARRAFPGFDEPSFKTPFDLSLTVPEKTAAIANTRQTSDERAEGDMRTLHFATTEPLPTYLVAFAVGPWDMTKPVKLAKNEVRKQRVPLRVLGPRGSKASLDYALKTTPAMVAELERYYGQPYPFDKLDLLAAPDFAYGAMENAGLVTFREKLLLLDDKSAAEALRDYYEVNVHELAHQWFGDLVTLRWWDDIWLNEAFATFMESKIMERLKPEYRARLGQLDATLGAMDNDSLVSARRIREPITESGDIRNGFDAITYQKGAGVLMMFENWVGEDRFRDGIRLFLARHARGTATSDDLIAALTEASGKGEELSRAMKTFLDQAGIPLVSTKLECAAGRPKLMLSQSRYFPLGSKGKPGAQWNVPVCLKLGRGADATTQCTLLTQPQQALELDACPDWYLPNAGASGYYRYSMPAADLAKLGEHTAALSPAEQVIHADAISAAFHRGGVGAEAVLQAMPRFASSTLPKVATYLLEDYTWILQRLADARGQALLRRHAAALYQPQIERLGYVARPGESPDDTLLRERLLDFLALDVHDARAREAMLAAAQELWRASTPDRLALESADANMLPTALAVMVQEGGEAVARRLMKELGTNRNPQQRGAMLEALGAADDPAVAALVREYALGGGLQLRELSSLYYAHKRWPANRAPFWDWLQAHFDAVLAPYPDFAQNRLPRLVASGMCSTAEAGQLEKFMAPKLPRIAGGKRALAQALEGVQLCAALRERKNAARNLRDWIATQAAAGEPTLADRLADPQRSAAFRSRDLYRHPRETLEFFEVKPDMSVAEIWPGAGWYAEILAPWLRQRGHYVAAGFVENKDTPEYRRQLMRDLRGKFSQSPERYDKARLVALGEPGRWRLAPTASLDRVLTFRNVHNWIAGGYEKRMFKAFFEALKPGGVLGVVEHRAAPDAGIEQMKASGYVTEDYVIQLAQDAGFRLVARSEINANPLDAKQYPEGVWTLPPVLRLKDQDREKYLAVGESDRMTLKFVKPAD